MPSPATVQKLCRARAFIRDYFREPIELADAAAEAELSIWHFLRLFRDVFGETPHEFLTRLRIDTARSLLAVSSRSVTDVCFDVGFSSLGSFSTLFTRQVGVSPIAFRRQARPQVSVPAWPRWWFVPACFAAHFGGSGTARLR
jgi:AraC-like DNA-binding protein